jgi:hypothetical protein
MNAFGDELASALFNWVKTCMEYGLQLLFFFEVLHILT